MGAEVLCIVLIAYIAWRERSHAIERHWLISRRGGVPPAPFASSRRRGKGGGARVISAEDDAAFLQAKERQEDDPIEGEIEEAE